MFDIIIPSYNREALLKKAIASAFQHVPDIRFISICDQTGYERLPDSKQVLVTRSAPTKAAGIARDTAARAILPQIPEDDVLLFIDDDITVTESFRENVTGLLDLLHLENTGVIQLAHMPSQKTKKITVGYTSGGNVCLAKRYLDIGGYGEDYLDDVEFFLRSHIAGFLNYQYAAIRNNHAYRSAGGLRDAHGVKSKLHLHLSLSRLDERYPEYMRKNPRTFMGFSLKRQARNQKAV